jgi:hypothetical protein
MKDARGLHRPRAFLFLGGRKFQAGKGALRQGIGMRRGKAESASWQGKIAEIFKNRKVAWL